MAELQTSADIGGQLTRKAIGYAAGFAAGFAVAKGVVDKNLVDQLVIIIPALIAALGDFAWWKKAQQKMVTVAGLEASPEPGTNAVAASLSKVIADAQK